MVEIAKYYDDEFIFGWKKERYLNVNLTSRFQK